MASQSSGAKLRAAIQDFEFKVDEPVAVKNAERREQWKEHVNRTFDRTRNLVERQREEVHAKVFAEISSQDDPEARTEIKQLRKADGRIDELMEVVKTHLAAFALGVSGDGRGPDVEAQLLDLRNICHEFAACVRAQEEWVASWFAESFDPDA